MDDPDRPMPNGVHKRLHTNGHRVERSCILCHRRKVKCNKQLPCSTCTKSGVLCCYPPAAGEKHEPRKSRTTISAIVDRLGQLERTIVAISSSDEQSTGTDQSVVDSPSPDRNGELGNGREERGEKGVLTHDGFDAPYVNDVLLSRVLKAEQDVRSVLQDPSEPQPQQLSIPVGMFSIATQLHPAHCSSLNELYPQKWQAMKLWQAYVQNVEPQNKLLHIPTAQVTVYEAINDPERAPAEVKCLLFAIYLAAVTALSPSEVYRLLSRDKASALESFRLGVELALSAANVFGKPTLMGVQALGIFIQVTRALNPGRSVWILLGMVMRTAQSIGLHRDPTNFSVSPFEAEMRRRLWWHLVSLDSRVAEDHGLTASTTHLTTDTHLPLAINDTDLLPSMTDLPTPSPNIWTEMTTLVLIYKTVQASQELTHLLTQPSTIPSETTRREIFSKLETEVEGQIKHYNSIIPSHRLTISTSRLLLRKLSFQSRQSLLSSNPKPKDINFNQKPTPQHPLLSATESFTDACTVIEISASLLSDELLYNVRWWIEMHPQYSALLYILWYLCTYPAAPDVSRGWDAVEKAWGMETCRLGRQEVGVGVGGLCYDAKWRALGVLREKALVLRDKVNGEEGGVGRGCEMGLQMGGGGCARAFGGEKMMDGMDGGMGMGLGEEMLGIDGGIVDWSSWMEDFGARD